jgi:hypothetical protein
MASGPPHRRGGDTATVAQASDYFRATVDAAASGGSLYDYRTTKPEFWPYLEQLTP